MASLQIISTSKAKLFDIPVKDGNLIFINDFSTIAFDIGGVRKLYTNINNINSSDKVNTKIPGFYYTTDTNVLWQFDGDKWTQITRSASEEDGIVNIKGTLANNIIVSELGTGIFAISGQYKLTRNGTTNITMSKDLFVCSEGQIQHVTSKAINKYTINEDGTVSTAHYVTDTDLDDFITRTEASVIIAEQLEKGVTDIVTNVLKNSMATTEDVQNLFV